jgi:hypothetical protein
MIKMITYFILGTICISCGGEDPDPTPQKTTTVVVGVPTNTAPEQKQVDNGQPGVVQNDHCMTADCNERNIPDPRHKDPVDEVVQTKFNAHQAVVIPKP